MDGGENHFISIKLVNNKINPERENYSPRIQDIM